NIEPQIASRTFEFGVGFANEIQNFVDAAQGRAESIAPAWHGVEIVRILEAIYESARTGRGGSLACTLDQHIVRGRTTAPGTGRSMRGSRRRTSSTRTARP